jgi:hypothetical protein
MKSKIKCKNLYSSKMKKGAERRHWVAARKGFKRDREKERSESQGEESQGGRMESGSHLETQREVLSTHEYCSLMLESMHEYYKRVEKCRKRREKECLKSNNFGLRIQSIHVKSENGKLIRILERRKSLTHGKSMKAKKMSVSESAQNSAVVVIEGERKELSKSIAASPESSAAYNFRTKKKYVSKGERK